MEISKMIGNLTEGVCFTSQDCITCKEHEIRYQADAQEFIFLDDSDVPEASIFSYTYLNVKAENQKNRPVIFAYAGGPGESVFTLSVGLLAPYTLQKDKLDDPTEMHKIQLEENYDWLLDICDIVLVDFPGTGYGKFYNKNIMPKYLNSEREAICFRKFVTKWLTKYHRWNSPIFLCGESYGGFRSAIYPYYLHGGWKDPQNEIRAIKVTGTIVLADINIYDYNVIYNSLYAGSPAIPSPINALGTCAATNWYHNPQGKPDLNTFINEAHKFAYDEYAHALLVGSDIDSEEMQHVAERLSYFTGIPMDTVIGMGLQIDAMSFTTQALAAQGLSCAIYDSRYTTSAGAVMSPTFDVTTDDAFFASMHPKAISLFTDFMQDKLRIDWDKEYTPHNFYILDNFDYQLHSVGVSVGSNDLLATSMRRNHDLKLFLARGIYDFCSPLGEGRYTLAHYPFPKDRVTYKEYHSGHHLYMGKTAKENVADDLRKFIRNSI